jgi:hypothetical protein
MSRNARMDTSSKRGRENMRAISWQAGTASALPLENGQHIRFGGAPVVKERQNLEM